MIRRVIIILCLISALACGAVPDGLWNGKPPEKAALLKQVDAGDPDAIAEWAYWCMNTYGGRRYDAETIHREALKAANAGSPLGDAMMAVCWMRKYTDEIGIGKAFRYAMKAHEAGHPMGSTCLAYVHLRDTRQGRWLNKGRALNLASRALRQGCIYACRFIITSELDGDDPTVIALRVRSFRRLIQVYKDCGHPRAAGLIARTEYRAKVEGRVDFPKELIEAADATVWQHLLLGEVHCAEPYLAELMETQPELHHETVLKLANMGNAGALRFIFKRYFYARNTSKESTNPYRMPLPNARKMAAEIAEQRFYNRYVAREAGNAYRHGQGVKKDSQRALHLYKLSAAMGHHPAKKLCVEMLWDQKEHPETYDPETAAHILTWINKDGDNNLLLYYENLLWTYSDQSPITEETRYRGLALYHGRDRRWKANKRVQKWMDERRDHLMKGASEVDDAVWKDLLERDYPFAEEFRRAAFEALIKKGFFPHHADFEGRFLNDNY